MRFFLTLNALTDILALQFSYLYYTANPRKGAPPFLIPLHTLIIANAFLNFAVTSKITLTEYNPMDLYSGMFP